MFNEKKKKIDMMLNEIVKNFHSETDTIGSYTGLPAGEDKNPVQDADDL